MNTSPEAKQAAAKLTAYVKQNWGAPEFMQNMEYNFALIIDAATANLREENKLLADMNNLLIAKNKKLQADYEDRDKGA